MSSPRPIPPPIDASSHSPTNSSRIRPWPSSTRRPRPDSRSLPKSGSRGFRRGRYTLPAHCRGLEGSRHDRDIAQLRIVLKAQGTAVIGVYAGFIDTDMAAQVTGEKTSPVQVAERALDGIRRGDK